MLHPRALAIGLAAAAQVFPWFGAPTVCAAEPVPPSAGTVIPKLPALPAPRNANSPELRVLRPASAAGANEATDATPIPVARLELVGNKVFSSAGLIAASGFTPGSFTLAQLLALAARMTDAYRQQGYFLAQVIVPAQDVDVTGVTGVTSATGGTVTLQVLEGQYGAVTLRNSSGLHDAVVQRLLGSAVAPGQAIAAAPLERSLLLMSDVPGVAVQSTLAPGAAVGSSDLLIDAADTRRYSGSVDMDNAGGPYTGRVRVGATLNVNNPLGLGDLFSVRVFGATNGLLQYGHVSYQLAAAQAQVGVGYSHMRYWLGGVYSSLSATGYGDIGSLFASYPLLRSRGANLNALLNFDAKYFSDAQRTAGTQSAKAARVLTATLSGDAPDRWGGSNFSDLSAVSNFAVTAVAGQLDLRGADAQAADFSTVHTNGNYTKLVYSGSRLQRIALDKSVFVSVNGQFANKNLDVSEKMALGGANAVRAFPDGEGYGDQGVLLKVEARWDLPRWQAVATQPQLFAFVDSGRVTLNKNNATPLPNERSLSGAGLGLNLVSDQDVLVRLVWAHKFGSVRATSSPDAASRVWLQLVKSL